MNYIELAFYLLILYFIWTFLVRPLLALVSLELLHKVYTSITINSAEDSKYLENQFVYYMSYARKIRELSTLLSISRKYEVAENEEYPEYIVSDENKEKVEEVEKIARLILTAQLFLDNPLTACLFVGIAPFGALLHYIAKYPSVDFHLNKNQLVGVLCSLFMLLPITGQIEKYTKIKAGMNRYEQIVTKNV